MKMFLNIVIKGEDSLENKFYEAVSAYPLLQVQIARSFANAVLLALRLDDNDKISVDGFNIGKVPEKEEAKKELSAISETTSEVKE